MATLSGSQPRGFVRKANRVLRVRLNLFDLSLLTCFFFPSSLSAMSAEWGLCDDTRLNHGVRGCDKMDPSNRSP